MYQSNRLAPPLTRLGVGNDNDAVAEQLWRLQRPVAAGGSAGDEGERMLQDQLWTLLWMLH